MNIALTSESQVPRPTHDLQDKTQRNLSQAVAGGSWT